MEARTYVLRDGVARVALRDGRRRHEAALSGATARQLHQSHVVSELAVHMDAEQVADGGEQVDVGRCARLCKKEHELCTGRSS